MKSLGDALRLFNTIGKITRTGTTRDPRTIATLSRCTRCHPLYATNTRTVAQGPRHVIPSPITLPRHTINCCVSVLSSQKDASRQSSSAAAYCSQAVGIGNPPDASVPLRSSQPARRQLRGETGGRHAAARGGEASPPPGPDRCPVAEAR